jgi:hypothetical protein
MWRHLATMHRSSKEFSLIWMLRTRPPRNCDSSAQSAAPDARAARKCVAQKLRCIDQHGHEDRDEESRMCYDEDRRNQRRIDKLSRESRESGRPPGRVDRLTVRRQRYRDRTAFACSEWYRSPHARDVRSEHLAPTLAAVSVSSGYRTERRRGEGRCPSVKRLDAQAAFGATTEAWMLASYRSRAASISSIFAYAQLRIAPTVSPRLRPRSVRRYSTVTGTVG